MADKTMRDAAIELAAQGYFVLPLEPNGKAPDAWLARNGVANATRDEEVIAYWWGRSPEANIGIACRGMLALDIDPRNGGNKYLAALVDEHGPLPETPAQRTGGGGLHFLFRIPVVTMLGKLVPGIDLVHGSRRYIVAAPSLHASGRRYEWLVPPTTRLAECPEWLVMLGRKYDPPPMRRLPSNIGHDALLARAVKYAAKLDPAISGSYGHNTAFRAACAMVRNFSSLDDDELLSVLSEWNARCSPPWSERDLRRKISQARLVARAA